MACKLYIEFKTIKNEKEVWYTVGKISRKFWEEAQKWDKANNFSFWQRLGLKEFIKFYEY